MLWAQTPGGMCCIFCRAGWDSPQIPTARRLRRQSEELFDEPILPHDVVSAHPSHLPLPDHVHCFVPLERPLRRLELAKPLLRFHPSFDRSMILFQHII